MLRHSVAGILPYSPLATLLGFTPLPASYFAFLGLATATYLVLVEIAKRTLIGDKPRRARQLPMTAVKEAAQSTARVQPPFHG